MMRTPEKNFALLYFENQSVIPELVGFKSSTLYSIQWFSPAHGKWKKKNFIKTDKEGKFVLSKFPDGQNPSVIDWTAKIVENL